jgi:tripartite-type tricarboxylate transporter receptor subunit TctC
MTVAGTWSLPALADEKYPNRPIKLVVPFPPGGPTDVFARRYAQQLGRRLGQTVVVENKAGAGGLIGADSVAKAKPDGYTMLFGSSSTQVTTPLLMPNPPYHPVKDFVLLVVGYVPMVITVNPGIPAKTLPEFVALLKAEPDKHRHSSSGPGSINHLGTELFKLKAGNLSALHVPYKGNNPALMAVLSGEVDFALDTFGTSISHYQGGKLRYLAVCADKRSQLVPDLPTTGEAGLPDVLVSTVNPVALPAATPPEIVAVITNATRQVLSDEGFLAEIRNMSIEPASDPDPVRSAAFFTGEMQRWAPIIKASGARMEQRNALTHPSSRPSRVGQ